MSRVYDHQFLVTVRSAWAAKYIAQLIADDIGCMEGSKREEERIEIDAVRVQPINNIGAVFRSKS